MDFSYTRVPTVLKGQKITSRQAAALARAGNDRILWGLGDGAWRVAMGYFNLVRQVRNSDASGLVFPPQAEFNEIYAHIEPEADWQWPFPGEPGDFEGANLANPLMQEVFGIGQIEGEADSTRNVPLWLEDQNRPPESDEDYWELGKRQRGVIDPDSFLQAVPALAAAEHFFRVSTPFFSPHGKAYGGYFPTPVELLSDCGDTEETGLEVPSWEIKFTALRKGVSTAGFHGTAGVNGDGLATITYAGSCPLGTDLTAVGHVVGMVKMPFRYFVAVNDGAGGVNVDAFLRSDWIEGPYEGAGKLSREDGGQLQRAIWYFAADFRGTPGQRTPDGFDIGAVAFDFQAFSTRQYYLAPAIGRFSGEDLEALYPTGRPVMEAGNRVSSGKIFTFTGGRTSHAIAGGFVFAGFMVRCRKLFNSPTTAVTVEILADGKVIRQVTLTPDGNGTASIIVWLAPVQGATPNIQARMGSAAQFTGADGFIEFQGAELVSYLPQWWDFALLLRMAASKGGDIFTGGVDGRGVDTDNALQVWRDYAAKGCIVNPGVAGVRDQAPWVTDHPHYDAARRMNREHVRIWGARQFHSYEVAGGKSILRLRRYVSGPGVPRNKFDAFKGFVGEIRKAAPKKGWSNRWVFFLQTKCYHWSESSNWKKDAYGYYFAWNNRCHFQSGSANSENFQRHVNYNYGVEVNARGDGTGFDTSRTPEVVQATFVAPEAPGGYNYAEGANGGADVPFFKSCQIYPAPYEIESADLEVIDGAEIVKLTFAGRFQAHEDAPATVDRDPMSWSGGEVTALRAEDYRTDDNAMREFARHSAEAGYQCSLKKGDRGVGSSLDEIFGSCIPHFFGVKLLSEPWEDDNEIVEESDTRATVDLLLQSESYLGFMCQGFVNKRTSEEITCQTHSGALYDYRYEDLCFDGFKGVSIGAFGLVDRADNPPGFGALPNTLIYADVFNRLGACWNLLTRVRVPLPFGVECRRRLADESVTVSPTAIGQGNCGSTPFRIIYDGSAPAGGNFGAWDVDPITGLDWSECGTSISASTGAAILATPCPAPGEQKWSLNTTREQKEYRVAVDSDVLNAIPAGWRGQIQSLGGFIGLVERTNQKPRAVQCAPADADPCYLNTELPPYPPWWTDGTTGFKDIFFDTVVSESSCETIETGIIDAGPPLGGVFAQGKSSSGAVCGNGAPGIHTVTVYTEPGFFVRVPLADL